MTRILIIDDDEPMRATMREMLEDAGYTVLDAEDGQSGIALFRRKPADLVITDIVMPGKEGIETIYELRRDFPGVRIVAISGAGPSRGVGSYLATAEAFGASGGLYKPFSQQELLEAVQQALVPGA